MEGFLGPLGSLVPASGPSSGLISSSVLDIHNSSCVNPAVCCLGGDAAGGGGFWYFRSIPSFSD